MEKYLHASRVFSGYRAWEVGVLFYALSKSFRFRTRIAHPIGATRSLNHFSF